MVSEPAKPKENCYLHIQHWLSAYSLVLNSYQGFQNKW
jgi:hypothetical protein